MQTSRANTLEEIRNTLTPEPLRTAEELTAFYRDEVNAVRGGSRIDAIALRLRAAHGGAFYKAFLTGHPGVGKSTELTRLCGKVADGFAPIRFSATQELNPSTFRPLDVLLLMLIHVVEHTARNPAEGGAGVRPAEALLKRLLEWFATESRTFVRTEAGSATVEVGGGWDAVIGLFARLKGEAKYAVERRREVVEYRLSRLSELLALANALIDDCTQRLKQRDGREWLLLPEDFDKPGIPADRTSELFVDYANIFKDLRLHMIVSLPIALAYSERGAELPFKYECVPDTPVFGVDHSPHAQGRAALQQVIAARADPALFDGGVAERLVVASGGNLRDLFTLSTQAAEESQLRSATTIGSEDAETAIRFLRTEYERRLGQSPHDPQPIGYPEKAEKLVAVYQGKPEASIPDVVLHSLLRARAVQEFNGDKWFGVHPLVVDILTKQRRLGARRRKGFVPGGTR